MRRTMWQLIVIGVVAMAGEARAQAIYTPRLSDLPKHEVGPMLGFYSPMDGGGFVGLRVTRSFNSLVAVEFSGDRKSGSTDDSNPSALMFTAAARLTPPIPPDLPRPYVTLGVARAFGFSWDHSPMVAAGIQGPWADGVFSFRMEVQRFTSGRRSLYNRARLVVSGVIGFGRHQARRCSPRWARGGAARGLHHSAFVISTQCAGERSLWGSGNGAVPDGVNPSV